MVREPIVDDVRQTGAPFVECALRTATPTSRPQIIGSVADVVEGVLLNAASTAVGATNAARFRALLEVP